MRLAAESDLEVVGEALDCEAALDLVQRLRPNVVLVDLESPHRDQIAMASVLRAICLEVPVIILSMHDDSLERAWAERANVAAFVGKSLPVEALLTTIRRVAGGYEPTKLALETSG